MTKTVEVSDALMGSGKTHAIITYMSEHQDRPWLYISPMLEEVDGRVPSDAQKIGFDLFVPQEDKMFSKSETCLKALEKGMNVCCTHNLMYKFSKKHLEAIKKNGYNVVSDEELNLINGYNTKREDIEFLLSNNLIGIDENSGEVAFLDEDMSLEARYGDIKAKSDLGMLYAAKRSSKFLVVQLSPKIIDCAERFILLTYNYKNSLMETFLSMHSYECKPLTGITLRRTDAEIKKELLERIEFIETPSINKIREKFPLSKNWWTTAKPDERLVVSKAIRSCLSKTKLDKELLFYTAPKDYVTDSKGFSTVYIGGGEQPEKSSKHKNADGVKEEHTKEDKDLRNFVACNARSTNKFAYKKLAVHAYNLFPNQAVKAFIQGQGFKVNDDVYALNMMLQWLFRGCIRVPNGEKMKVAILSRRMNTLFKEWLLKRDY